MYHPHLVAALLMTPYRSSTRSAKGSSRSKIIYQHFNRVKLGLDAKLNEWLAVKILLKRKAATPSSDFLKNFVNEARILSICDHPNIISLKRVSISGNLVDFSQKQENGRIAYYVTNYAKYGELFKVIKKMGALSESIARAFFLQILQGIF